MAIGVVAPPVSNTREPRKALDRSLLVANDPLTALEDIQTFRSYLDERELTFVKLARMWGKTWEEIADTVGITPEAAWALWHGFDESSRSN
jgi:hypothetical protein